MNIFFDENQTPVRGIDSTPKSTFQTPVSHRVNVASRSESFASILETPKSALKQIKVENQSADAEKIIADDSGDSNEIKSDRKENPKIKFVECTVADDEQNYHTPTSFKMNKFMMCFKSEPDLSRVQNTNKDATTLNRGRFIAKKLLSGVSMVNLRRPLANSNEKQTNAMETVTNDTETVANSTETEANSTETVANSTETVANSTEIVANDEMNKEIMQNDAESCETVQHDTASSITTPTIIADNVKIDDDDEDFVDDEEVDREYDDSADKENRLPHHCKTIDFIPKLEPVTALNCALSDSIATVNDSVSPITKSTHRMSKAMQVINHQPNYIVFNVKTEHSAFL